MHGRVKVRTTEEEKLRKQKEQALKVKAYKSSMKIIIRKRQQQEYDDEMLKIITPMLLRNPDITTLWNIRRECILAKQQGISNTTIDAKENDNYINTDNLSNTEASRIQKMLENDLALTEQCLLVNSKSYNIWHHRIWLLQHTMNVNWSGELSLCNKYLKMDERNFHTWDYRRYVASKAEVSLSDELKFCNEKIKSNFSNYSSWHQRSLLLPVLYPSNREEDVKRPMSEEILKEELDMVLTATFTDPDDSSAWFYQRWLLGFTQPNVNICAFRVNRKKAIIAFTKPISLDGLKVDLVGPNNTMELHNWKTWSTTHALRADTTFTMSLSDLKQIDDLLNYQHLVLTTSCMKCSSDVRYELNRSKDGSLYYFRPMLSAVSYNQDVINALKSQLTACENLLQYEPNSKWTLLTTALLMRAIDCHKYHKKSLEHLYKLQTVDSLRANYYKDLASKWILQKALQDWCFSSSIPHKLDLTQSTDLSTLTDKQYLSIADEVCLPTMLESRYNNLKTFGNI